MSHAADETQPSLTQSAGLGSVGWLAHVSQAGKTWLSLLCSVGWQRCSAALLLSVTTPTHTHSNHATTTQPITREHHRCARFAVQCSCQPQPPPSFLPRAPFPARRCCCCAARRCCCSHTTHSPSTHPLQHRTQQHQTAECWAARSTDGGTATGRAHHANRGGVRAARGGGDPCSANAGEGKGTLQSKGAAT